MKRYSCTVSDKRGEFGDAMEQSQQGVWVRLSDVERLASRERELEARCERLTSFINAIADTCEELSNDQLANLRGGALGIAHSARKNLPKVISGAAPAAKDNV